MLIKKMANSALKKLIFSGATNVPTKAVTSTRSERRGLVKSTISEKNECLFPGEKFSSTSLRIKFNFHRETKDSAAPAKWSVVGMTLKLKYTVKTPINTWKETKMNGRMLYNLSACSPLKKRKDFKEK
jgi:hypothetical protein